MSIDSALRVVLGISIAVLAACLASCGYGFFPEASFPLTTGCRIPKWFQPTSGNGNIGMNVRMDVYLEKLVFTLSDKSGNEVTRLTAGRKSIYPTELMDRTGHRASYEIAYVGSAVEALVIEYRGGGPPSFCPVDDPSILKALGL